MAKLTKLQVFGVKQETTQNTAIALVAADYMLVDKAEVNPVPGIIPRPLKRASLDRLASILGKLYVEVDVEVEIKGSGARGTSYAPLAALLCACGTVETVNAGTSVIYAPTSVPASANYFGAGKSCTISVYENGIFHTIAGCIAKSAKMVLKAGERLMLQVKLAGIYSAPTDTAFPSVTYNEATKPPTFQSASFTVDSFAANIAGLEIDFGLETTLLERASSPYGVGGFQITGRDPQGSIDPEATTVAAYDWFSKLLSRNEGAIAATIGSVTGNIIGLALPKAQYNDVKYADRGGIRVFQVPLQFNQSTGDDWFTLTIT